MAKVVILSGSNSGNREFFLEAALELIQEKVGSLIDSSGLYETEPWGFEAEQNFLNQVWLVESTLEPLLVLQQLLQIEEQLGRVRDPDGGYSSRVIDLDILYFDDLIIDLPELTVPHPRIQDRNFVLQPLCEILPDMIHPVFNKTNTELLAVCTDSGIATRYRV